MKVHAQVGYVINIVLNTSERDPEKLREKIIKESDKLFNRQFSEGQIVFCSIPEVIEKEKVVWDA